MRPSSDRQTRNGHLMVLGDVVVGLLAGLALLGLIPHEFEGRPALDGLMTWLSYVLGYPIAAAVAVGFTTTLRATAGAFAANGIGIAIFVLGFLVPFYEQRAASAARAELVAAFATRSELVRRKWRADVDVAGAHGGPGREPPMLAVVDDGAAVTLTNVTDTDLDCVQLARVGARSGAGGNLRCFMRDTRGADECALLPAGAAVQFKLNASMRETAACEAASLEFRVGDYAHPEPSWWSDSALARFEADSSQAPAVSARNAIESYATRGLSFDALAAEYERIGSLLDEPDRADRWRDELDGWQEQKADHRESTRLGKEAERQRVAAEMRRLETTLTDLAARRRGDLAPPAGTVPSFLDVEDHGRTVVVRNLADRPLDVRVMWSGTQVLSGREWDIRCYMWPESHVLDVYAFAELEAGEAETYSVHYDDACPLVEELALAFAVYDRGSLLWVNAPELARIEVEATAELGKLGYVTSGDDLEAEVTEPLEAAIDETPIN